MLIHKHKFVIPIEFNITEWFYKGDGSGQKPGALVARKLLCRCGKSKLFGEEA